MTYCMAALCGVRNDAGTLADWSGTRSMTVQMLR
jgi:hypothetical protein